MKRSLLLLVSIVGALWLARIEASDSVSVLYELSAESTYSEGCFGQCLCPVFQVDGLAGTFVLTPKSVDPLFRNFDISEIDWTVPTDPSKRVTGSGTYRVGGEVASMHQLELDLIIDGAEPVHFDSGLIVGGSEFPLINISVSMNDLVCFDTVFGVIATPAVVEAVPYELSEESSFTEGCFEPCRCPIFQVAGVTGTFNLTLADFTGLDLRFDVSDIEWTVPTDPPKRVRGSGTYRVGSGSEPMHRLQLDLVIDDGDPQHFDSDLVPGGGEFPRIDISVSINAMVCFDTVFSIVAEPVENGKPTEFVRGDCNDDGTFNIADPVRTLMAVFWRDIEIPCEDACDANDDSKLNIADASYDLNGLFLRGPAPLPPFPDCGPDPGPASLGCELFSSCR